MNIKEYTEICLDFAKESSDWMRLDERQHYTTCSQGGWYESCDNADGGIDVSWAFHESESYIRERAPHKFVDKLLQIVQVAIDDEWDAESLHYIMETFS